ncbi:hypothetical protein AMATHDRAFT_1741 [Amanita thiersii Skay4041]|uniref:Uncharacterized protein n=1 Tax=Amanita thiersii Skay4041 TaxID=703135 RepID=A0A2A9NSD6_9AGAR|nr:hypothetical protein AMATHDRAFT_1741 [Amanita thiersii Skay4041]
MTVSLALLSPPSRAFVPLHWSFEFAYRSDGSQILREHSVNLHAPSLRQLKADSLTGGMEGDTDIPFPFASSPSLKHLTWSKGLDVHNNPSIPWNQGNRLAVINSGQEFNTITTSAVIKRYSSRMVRRNLEIYHDSTGQDALFGSFRFPSRSNLTLIGNAPPTPARAALEESSRLARPDTNYTVEDDFLVAANISPLSVSLIRYLT